MNGALLGAAALVVAIAAAHSILGERLIFRHLRRAGELVPYVGGQLLREYQLRIIWGAWHVMTALGLGLAAVLVWLAQPAAQAASGGWIEASIAAAMAASGLLVLISNRGRHPAWAAFFAVTLLICLR